MSRVLVYATSKRCPVHATGRVQVGDAGDPCCCSTATADCVVAGMGAYCRDSPFWEYMQANPTSNARQYLDDFFGSPSAIRQVHIQHCHKLHVWRNRVAVVHASGAPTFGGGTAEDNILDTVGLKRIWRGYRRSGFSRLPFFVTAGDAGSGLLDSKPNWFPNCEIGGYAETTTICADIDLASVNALLVADYALDPGPPNGGTVGARQIVLGDTYDVLLPVTGATWYCNYNDVYVIPPEDGPVYYGPVYCERV